MLSVNLFNTAVTTRQRPIFQLEIFSLVVGINCTNQLYNKIAGQFNECLLLWQSSDMYLYLTVIIFICFMLCWKIKYDDDDDLNHLATWFQGVNPREREGGRERRGERKRWTSLICET